MSVELISSVLNIAGVEWVLNWWEVNTGKFCDLPLGNPSQNIKVCHLPIQVTFALLNIADVEWVLSWWEVKTGRFRDLPLGNPSHPAPSTFCLTSQAILWSTFSNNCNHSYIFYLSWHPGRYFLWYNHDHASTLLKLTEKSNTLILKKNCISLGRQSKFTKFMFRCHNMCVGNLDVTKCVLACMNWMEAVPSIAFHP